MQISMYSHSSNFTKTKTMPKINPTPRLHISPLYYYTIALLLILLAITLRPTETPPSKPFPSIPRYSEANLTFEAFWSSHVLTGVPAIITHDVSSTSIPSPSHFQELMKVCPLKHIPLLSATYASFIKPLPPLIKVGLDFLLRVTLGQSLELWLKDREPRR